MKKKRKKIVVVVGWLLIGCASFLFYNAVMVISEILIMPWSLNYILTHSDSLTIVFFTAVATLLFAVMFFIGALGILFVKRWAVVVLCGTFILEFVKRFLVMKNFSGCTALLFGIEGVLFALLLLCYLPKKSRLDFN